MDQLPLANVPLCGTIHVKFDDPDAGKSHKNPSFAREELQDCLPIIATMKTFPYCHKKYFYNCSEKTISF